MKLKSLFFILSFVFSAYVANALDAPAMPMFKQPDQQITIKQPDINKEEIFKIFNNAYKAKGEPRIALFWNRKFDDRLSQWEATLRLNITEEVHEILAPKQNRQGLGGEAVEFEFSAGFTQPFLLNGVKIVDRHAIMRLVERVNSNEAEVEMVADYQKIETDALVGYADYFVEIVFTPENNADLGMGFLISIKEVNSGQIVAMFRSDAIVPNKTTPKATWAASSTGYKKVYPQKTSIPADEVGEQLAVETMKELTKYW